MLDLFAILITTFNIDALLLTNLVLMKKNFYIISFKLLSFDKYKKKKWKHRQGWKISVSFAENCVGMKMDTFVIWTQYHIKSVLNNSKQTLNRWLISTAKKCKENLSKSLNQNILAKASIFKWFIMSMNNKAKDLSSSVTQDGKISKNSVNILPLDK